MTIEQSQEIYSRPGFYPGIVLQFNQIRSGWIGKQESLIAVGVLGIVLVWDLSNLELAPVFT